ncbi:hypothetical protein GCM10017673_06380 [Streptosporangium violaceochromogenes]|nr:hypothetical protein GCM10017673_06380 [Streptosporangium violaceochromogenes]
MSWREVTEGTVRAGRSPLESVRFGREVDRLTVPVAAGDCLPAVRDAVLRSRADVVVLRYPAEHVGWFAELAVLGRAAVFADCLLYWRLRAGEGRAPVPSPDLTTAGPGDPAVTRDLVGGIFAAYGNHYRANPLFGAAEALAGYQEWALAAAEAGGCLTLRERGTGAVWGMATLEETGPRTEILLAGVVPGARGRGVYAHLLRAVEERALARGAAEVVISTQAHNTRVQRAWARYGFAPAQALLTVHLIRPSHLPRSSGAVPAPTGAGTAGPSESRGSPGPAEAPARSRTR